MNERPAMKPDKCPGESCIFWVSDIWIDTCILYWEGLRHKAPSGICMNCKYTGGDFDHYNNKNYKPREVEGEGNKKESK